MINDLKSFGILLAITVLVYLVSYLVFRGLAAIIQRMTGSSHGLVRKQLSISVRFLLAVIALNIAGRYTSFSTFDGVVIDRVIHLLLIAAVAMLLIKLSAFVRDMLYERFDVTQQNNLHNRKLRTQIDFLQKIISVFIVFLAISIALMSFERVREMGTSLIASAGIASVIIGFAAQKSIANLLAGFQIAFTQPLRLDDVVIVEGEWGRVEEITLTYVVISIWDQRRLIVPIAYFLEKPFQNWTRNSADLLGSIFIYADYSFPVDFLREELKQILNGDDARALWDGRASAVQVTDITDKVMQIRVLVSAASSGAAFELRCMLRERLLQAISKSYPRSLPRVRFEADRESDHHTVSNGPGKDFIPQQ